MKKKTAFRDLKALEREEALKAAKKLEGDEASVFTSVETRQYLDSLAASITGRYGANRIRTHVSYDASARYVGFTNGNAVEVNAASDLIQRFKTLPDKIDATHGVVFHEFSHILYADWDKAKDAQEMILKEGKLYGKLPTATDQQSKTNLDALKEAVENTRFRPFFAKLVNSLENSIIDQNNEERINKDFGGYVKYSVLKVRNQLHMDCDSFERIRDYTKNKDLSNVGAAEMMVLQMARFGDVLAADPNAMQSDPLYLAVASAKPDIEKAVLSEKTEDLYTAINSIIFHIWELIVQDMADAKARQEQQQQQQQQQGGQSDGLQKSAGAGGSSGGNDGKENDSGNNGGSGSNRDKDGKESNSSGSNGESKDNQNGKKGSAQRSSSASDELEKAMSNADGADSKQGDNSSQNGDGPNSKDGKSNNSNQNGNSSENSDSQSSESGSSQSNGGSDNQQGMSLSEILDALNNMSDEEIAKMMSELDNAEENASSNGNNKPQNQRSEPSNGNNTSEQSKEESQKIDDEEAKQMGEKIAQRIINAMANAMAAENARRAASNDLLVLARNAGKSSEHRNIDVHASVQSEEDAGEYQRIAIKQKATLKSLIRQMKTAFKDMRLGDMKRHQVVGRTFRACDAHRLDGLCFATNKMRSNDPDIAIAVLVDQSGSMSGQRIQAARESALLIYDFCQEFNIPCMISGHWARTASTIDFHIFSDFRKVKGDEKRIAAGLQKTDGCNRDGLALQTACSILEKRPEPVKLLMIVSDGQPNHMDYRGKAAEEDIKETVKKFQRRGVATIAFAIGEDKDRIKEIYGERFVDISDLNTMPKKLANIVKREVIRASM